jgi:general secretion pathway protein E
MMERSGKKQQQDLGEFLQKGGFIKADALRTAREEAQRTGKKLAEVLLVKRLVAPEMLSMAYTNLYNARPINLNQYDIQPDALALIPEQTARENNILPLAIEGNTLIVAMEDPSDTQLIEKLSNLARKIIQPAVPFSGSIRAALDSNYRLITPILPEVFQEIANTAVPLQGQPVPGLIINSETADQESPVVRAVNMILRQAVRDRASDIHIEPHGDILIVRCRIDGVLHETARVPKGTHSSIVSRIKVMGNMNIAEKRRPQDGQFSATVEKRAIDFRIATAETINGEKVVIRILDKSLSMTNLAEVGFSAQSLENFRRVLGSPFGMVLVSGPTGSGKTTTLYAGLRELDPIARNISTIEDPVEYHFDGINQIQVNVPAEITFARGLRALMRMDPDIILVGEIRDQETANVAIQASLTGHLVLSSIHANDAVGAIVRLIDLGVEPFLVTSAVIATLSQRLVRKVCPYCRTLAAVSADEAMAYQEELQETRKDFYLGGGCNFCSRTGFLGRTAVIEMLPISDQIRQLINRRATAAEIKTQALREGMVGMRRDGMLKARDGITTPGEIIRNVYTIG